MIPGIVDSAVSGARSFIDEFPGDGALATRWSATRGTWTKTAGDAVSSTTASSYPLLSFNANTQKASSRTEGGTTNTFGWGVAFWVVDANNWWAVVSDRTTYTGVVGTTIGYPCGGGQCGGGCASCPCTVCDGPGCTGNCTFVAYPTATVIPVNGPRYKYNIRLLSSVSGSISTVSTAEITDSTSAGLTIGYVQAVVDAAGQITATAQMSSGGAVAQIQTTPSSPNRGRRYGVLLAPASNGTQSNGLERFVFTSI